MHTGGLGTWGGGDTMYTHASKCKNDKIRKETTLKKEY
jgi:hypothetical protein